MMLGEVRKLLADRGHGTENADLFYGFLPGEPVDATCVFDSQGDPAVLSLCGGTSGVAYEQPRGQVQVRRAVFADALTEAELIYRTLLSVDDEDLSGTRYLSIQPTPPFTLQKDQAETPIRVVNFVALKELS
jgi:hypothetical protein